MTVEEENIEENKFHSDLQYVHILEGRGRNYFVCDSTIQEGFRSFPRIKRVHARDSDDRWYVSVKDLGELRLK